MFTAATDAAGVSIAAAAGCATNERVASIDTRLGALEAAIQFEKRLAKAEAAAAAQSSSLAELTGTLPVLERRVDALRIELAKVSRAAAKHENTNHKAMPTGMTMALDVKQSEAPTKKEASDASGWSADALAATTAPDSANPPPT